MYQYSTGVFHICPGMMFIGSTCEMSVENVNDIFEFKLSDVILARSITYSCSVGIQCLM